MKRELYVYAMLGLLTTFLVFIQFWFPNALENSKESIFKPFDNLGQLLIEVESTVYLVEGEQNNIMVEGPENILKKITTHIEGGCISIKNSTNSLFSGLLGKLLTEGNHVNIYITLPDLSDFVVGENEPGSTIKYRSGDRIGLSLKKGEKIIIESKTIKGCT